MLDMLLGQLTLDVGRFRHVLKVPASAEEPEGSTPPPADRRGTAATSPLRRAHGSSSAQSRRAQIAASDSASALPGSGVWAYAQRTSGGIDIRIDSTRPSVRRPNTVPRS